MDFDPVKAGLGVPVDQKASASTNTQKDFDPVSSGLGVPVNGLPTSNVSDRGINWIDKFSGVSSMEGDPALNKAAIVNSYIATKMKGVPKDFVDKNPDVVHEVYAQDYLHLPGTKHTPEQLYDAIGKNLGVDEITKRNAELPAWTVQYTHPSDGGPAYSGEFNKALPPIHFDKFLQSLTKPMAVLPRAPDDLPDHPELGPLNPKVLGGAWNGIAPLIEGGTSPAAVGAVAMLPELALAAATSPVAAGVLWTIKSGWALAAYVSAANQTPERKRVLNDPKSTTEQKSAVVARQIATLLSGVVMEWDLLPKAKTVTAAEIPIYPAPKELPAGEVPLSPTSTGESIPSSVIPGSSITPIKSEPILTVQDLKGLSVKDTVSALSYAAANASSAADAHVYQNAHDAILPLAVSLPGEPPSTNEPYAHGPTKPEDKPAALGDVQQEPGSLKEAPKTEIDETRNLIREIQDSLQAIADPYPDEFRITPDDSPKPLTEDEQKDVSKLEEVHAQDKIDPSEPIVTAGKIKELTEDTNNKVQNVMDALNEALDLSGSYETSYGATALERAQGKLIENNIKFKETIAKLREVLGNKIDNLELNMGWQLAKQKYFIKKAANEKIEELNNEHKQEILDLKTKHQEQLSDLRYRKNDQIDIIRSEASDRYAALQAKSQTKLSNLIGLDKQGRFSYDVLRRALLDVANRLPADSRGNFVAAITDALRRPVMGRDPEGMYSKTYALTWRMMLELDKVERQNLVDKINKTIKKSLDSPSVDVVAKQRIKEALARVLSKDGQASIEAYGFTPDSDNPAVDHANFNVEMISQTAAKDLPRSVLQALADRVDILQQAGRRLVKFRKFQFQSIQDQLENNILTGPSTPINKAQLKQVYGIGASPAQKFKINFGNAVASNMAWLQNGNRQFLNTDIVSNMLEGLPKDNYGQLSRYLKGTIDLGHNARLNLYAQATKPIADVLKKYPEFTKDESYRIGIYGILQNENGLQRIKDSGITEAQATGITLTNKEAQMYIAIRQSFDNVLPLIKKTYRVLNNKDLIEQKNYWPHVRDFSISPKSPQDKLVTEVGGQQIDLADAVKNNDTMIKLLEDVTGFRTKKTPQGFVQERIPDAVGAVKLNGIEVALAHINQASHYVAQQADLTMLANIVSGKKFAAKYGDVGQKYWLDVLDSVARDADPSTATRVRVLDTLVRNINVGEIGWRLLPQFKHLPNVVLTLQHVRPDVLTHALDRSTDPDVKEWLMKNFAEIATRRTSEVAYEDILEKSIFAKANKNSFFIESLIDQLHGKASVIGYVMQELKDSGQDWKNFVNIPLDVDLQKRALKVARESVNSTLRKDLPLAVSRGTLTAGNMSYTKAFTAFQGIMYKNYGLIYRDVYNKGVKKKNISLLMGKLLLWLLYYSGVGVVGFGDKKIKHLAFGSREPDGLSHEVFTDAFRTIPLSNMALAFGRNQTGVPVVDVASEFSKSLYDLYNDRGNYGKSLSPLQRQRLIAQMATAAGVLSGVGGAGELGRIFTPTTGKKAPISLSDMRDFATPIRDQQ